MQKYTRGVTLMEVLIVVVIVGILTAIAYPNYQQYVARAKRTEAKAALLQIATNQERHYLQNNSYTTDMRNLGFSTAGNHPTDSGAYIVNVDAADANDFSATATYQLGGDEAGKCLTFSIDGRGARESAPQTDCWTRTQ
ncbi:MAG: type IV pilin protein [Woeseia sp.]